MQKTELLQVPETMDVQELVDEAPRFWFSRRWRVAFLSCIGFLIVTTHRVCIEVAVTGMLNQTAIHGLEDVPTDDMTPYWFPGREHDRSLPSRREVEALTADNVIVVVTPRPSIHAEELSKKSDNSTPLLHFHVCSNASELNILNTSLFTFPKTGYLVWTEVQKQAILDAFYWGDLLIRLPAGFLSQRYGGKRLLGFAILLESLCTAVIPLTASVHYFTVILLRFITGASAGATVPAMNYLLGRWAPPDERCLLLAIANTGSWVSGSVIAIPLSGLLCSYGFDGGWPAAFYIFGGIGMLWCIVWMLLANDSPIQDSRIAIEERDYIISSLIVADSPSEKLPTTMTQTNHKAAFKWSVALTSLPVFALTICHFSHEWAIYILLKVFPIYMKRNLQFDIKQNSVGTLLPGIGFWFVMLASAGAADRLQGYGVLGATHIRKIMNTTGAVVTAAMIVSMMFLDCNHYLGALFIVIIGLSFCGMQYSGALVSHLDIASRYSALIAGATSTIGASVHFVVPALIRLLLMDCTDQDSEQFQWNVLFIATASCHLFTAIVFLLFGSGQSQSNWFVVDPITTGNDVTKSSAEFPLTAKSDEFDYGGHGRINRDFYAPYVGTGYPVMSRTISMAPSTDIDDRMSPHDNYDAINCIGTGHVPLMTDGDVRDDTKSSNESLHSFVSTASDDIEAFAMQPEVNRGVHITSSIENSLQADRDLSESVV